MTDQQFVEAALKAGLWEEAKGKLRAVVAVQGAHRHGYRFDEYEELNDTVEKFISYVEEAGLQE